jgi:hypothetical protein
MFDTSSLLTKQQKSAEAGGAHEDLSGSGTVLELNTLIDYILENLDTLRKYLERMEGFIQAQTDLIEMVTYDGASSGLREKRKALKLDTILEDAKDIIMESQRGTEQVRSIVEKLISFSPGDEE